MNTSIARSGASSPGRPRTSPVLRRRPRWRRGSAIVLAVSGDGVSRMTGRASASDPARVERPMVHGGDPDAGPWGHRCRRWPSSGPACSSPPSLPLSHLGLLAYEADGDIFVADWDGQNPVRIADGGHGAQSGCGSDGYWIEGPSGRLTGGSSRIARHAIRSSATPERRVDDLPQRSDGSRGRVIPRRRLAGRRSPDSTRVATVARLLSRHEDRRLRARWRA